MGLSLVGIGRRFPISIKCLANTRLHQYFDICFCKYVTLICIEKYGKSCNIKSDYLIQDFHELNQFLRKILEVLLNSELNDHNSNLIIINNK